MIERLFKRSFIWIRVKIERGRKKAERVEIPELLQMWLVCVYSPLHSSFGTGYSKYT